MFSFWFIFKCFSSKFRSPKSSTLAPSRRLILSRKNTNNMLEFSCNLVKTEATFQRISNIGKTVEKRIKKAHCKKANFFLFPASCRHNNQRSAFRTSSRKFPHSKKHNTSRKTPETWRKFAVKLSMFHYPPGRRTL